MNRRPVDWVTLIVAGLSLIGTIYVEATHNDRENATRISALESHRADDNSRLDRIENKLDKLVDWAMGRK
jgi:hypothetical protein